MNPISFSFPIYEEIAESVFIDMKPKESIPVTLTITSVEKGKAHCYEYEIQDPKDS